MCLAIPARIIKMKGDFAIAEISGNLREINVSLIEKPQIGDYVLLHAGFAIERIAIEEAQEILNLIEIE